jgi:gentisate 1,2-dioxygenase
MDASKVAPNLYKVTKDTMGIRILHATYKPGQSSAMHSHHDLVLYIISGGTTEFTRKDGKKDKRELKTGMSMVVPAVRYKDSFLPDQCPSISVNNLPAFFTCRADYLFYNI